MASYVKNIVKNLKSPKSMSTVEAATESQTSPDSRITYSQDVFAVRGDLEYSQNGTYRPNEKDASEISFMTDKFVENNSTNGKKRQRVESPVATNTNNYVKEITEIKDMCSTILDKYNTTNDAVLAMIDSNKTVNTTIADILQRLIKVEKSLTKDNVQSSVKPTPDSYNQQREANQINKERRKDLLIHRIPESFGPSTLDSYVINVLKDLGIDDYDIATRKGPKQEDTTRPVKVILMRERDKITALKNRRNLRDNPKNLDEVYVTDHVSDMTLKEHQILQNIANQLKAANHLAFVPNMVPRQMHYKKGPYKKMIAQPHCLCVQ